MLSHEKAPSIIIEGAFSGNRFNYAFTDFIISSPMGLIDEL
jgi:hypothetical protein